MTTPNVYNDGIQQCPHCGNAHTTKCPLVKSYEYHENGLLKRIEFFAPNDYGPLTVVRAGDARPASPQYPFLTTTWGAGGQND